MAKQQRLTFEFTRGWNDHLAGKDYRRTEDEQWRSGWLSRESYHQSIEQIKTRKKFKRTG